MWVIEDRRSGTVLEFDEAQGYGFIIEDDCGEELFVNRRAVKSMSELHWQHSLRRGERVMFARVKGVKGWWAAAVQRIEPPREKEVWDEAPQSRETPSPPGLPGYRSPARGSVYVEGQSSAQVTNQAKS